MSHSLRPLEPHLTLHVTAHATGRRLCFPDDGARVMFKCHLLKLSRSLPVEIHAFALMDNHVHLLLTARKHGATAELMRSALAVHAVAMNRLGGHPGQLWRDRHHTVVVDSVSHALHACLYIDANPWRARLVEHPMESDWTSYRELAAGMDAAFLTPHPVLLDLGQGDDWRLRYQEIMDEYLRRGARVCCPGRRISQTDPLAGLRLASWRE